MTSDRVASSASHGFVVDVAVVEVDRDTGEVAVLDYVTVHDAGRLLNPLLAEGQVRGGLAHGAAAALFERHVYDEDGNLLTGSFMDYLVPTAPDLPTPRIGHRESPSPFLPLGAKGLGEGTTMSVPAAIANAVADALGRDDVHGRMLDRRMPIDEVISTGIAMADALADLHRQHVLHLDLKPANVLFRPGGEAVLIDFGLSRHEQLPDLLEEQFHRPTGTTEYMAPEQLLRIRSDKRSDLFAFGAILYQMATGELPFGAPGRIKQVRQRVWRDPVPPRSLQSAIPPPLQEIILRCLDPRPDRRYATADDVAFELRHLDLVELTERAHRVKRDDLKTALKRWLHVSSTMREIAATAKKPPPRPPIILVAVDLRPGFDSLRHNQLEAAVSTLANMPGARLACLNVMQTSLISIDENVDAAGDNIHVLRIAELRRWADPLQLPRGKITYHLVEARSIPAGIIDFAQANKVDHLIIGAPAGGATASRMTAQVTAEAPCSVTVVRASQSHADNAEVAPGAL